MNQHELVIHLLEALGCVDIFLMIMVIRKLRRLKKEDKDE